MRARWVDDVPTVRGLLPGPAVRSLPGMSRHGLLLELRNNNALNCLLLPLFSFLCLRTIQSDMSKRGKRGYGRRALWCVLLLSVGTVFVPLEAQTYATLWKQVDKFRGQDRPRSALQVVEQSIAPKALREGNEGQALAAELTACVLRQTVSPDSFFADVCRLERRKASASTPSERAVLASVLGEVYALNRGRSQQVRHHLSAPSDSVQEWSVEQYDSAAHANYLLSVSEAEALLRVPAAGWTPFVVSGRDATYYHNDLLNVVGRRALDGLEQLTALPWTERRAEVGQVAGRLLACYRRDHNREAELLLMLDSVERAERTDFSPWRPMPVVSDAEREEAVLRSSACLTYLRLIRTFSDLPVVTEVYLRLVQLDVSARQKIQWAEEGRALYPRYARTVELTQTINRLQQPELSGRSRQVYYPGRRYDCPLRGRNLSALTVRLYRMDDAFDEEQMNRQTDASAYVRRHGTFVETFTHTFVSHLPYETFTDTLSWKAPSPGLYVAVCTPSAPSGAWDKPRPSCVVLPVSAFRFVAQSHPDGTLRGYVVDDADGRPVSGATVRCYCGNPRTLYRQLTTDSIGGITLSFPSSEYVGLYVRVSTPTDRYMPEQWVSKDGYAPPADAPVTTMRLYTDRALYRPGQEVQWGGVVFTTNRRSSRVVTAKEYEARLYDANGKEIASRTVKTDEMGTIASSFMLPETGLPGHYRLAVGTEWLLFRVEAYKRPTFRVTFVPVTARYAAGDTLHVQGEARMFSGVPVRRARVCGTWRCEYPYRWGHAGTKSPMPLDTLYTDENGTFTVALPLSVSPAALRRGCRLTLNVDVLSPSGETRSGVYSLPLSSSPLRLEASVPGSVDRDRPASWRFRLLSPTDAPVTGTVRYALYDADKSGTPVLCGEVEAGRSFVPADMGALPSGRYRVHAAARVEADTATWCGSLLLFGTADTRVPVDTAAWFYCPCDTFAAGRPATICVGSSCRDVSMFYTLASGSEVLEHRLITFSDSLLRFEYPYTEAYGDGLVASFLFVKDGCVHTYRRSLKHEAPDTRLRWCWTTFRDRLTPGAQEEWCLTLRTPDGRPAPARLMAVLYDASLDALVRHDWSLSRSYKWHFPSLRWRGALDSERFGGYSYLHFPLREKPVPMLQFDAFDAGMLPAFTLSERRLFDTMLPTASVRPVKSALAAKSHSAEIGRRLEEVVLKGTSVENEEAADASAAGAPDAVPVPEFPLRTRFNETAFFYPRLNADGDGKVSLRFTLPESLTTWRFLGVAHTADMFTAELEARAVASKDFMARLVLPRFLRAGDASALGVALDNLSDAALDGTLRLELLDAVTEQRLHIAEGHFRLAAAGDTVWQCTDFVPSASSTLLICRVTAVCGDRSDGEQVYLPVLPAEDDVMESVPVWVDGKGTAQIDLSHLFADNASSARDLSLTIEYTAHPLWTAVMALPVLEEPRDEDVLSVAAAYYAGMLAGHIARTTPGVQSAVERWKQAGDGHTLWSNLRKNEELTRLLLDETPWVREAGDEAERRARLVTLFDENRNRARATVLLERLKKMQGADGGLSWYPGMPGNEYLTTEVVGMLVRLQRLLGPSAEQTADRELMNRALAFLKVQNARRVENMRRSESRGGQVGFPSVGALRYIVLAYGSGTSFTASEQRDNQYVLQHIESHPVAPDPETCALAALALHRAGRTAAALGFLTSLKEHLTMSDTRGAYFDYPSGSFSSIDKKLSVHVLVMEVLAEVDPADRILQTALRRHLLQQKRVQAWGTPVNSAGAIYALLRDNGTALAPAADDRVTLTLRRERRGGSRKVAVVPPAKGTAGGAETGYVRYTCSGDELSGQPLTLTVTRASEGEAWGAVYARYRAPFADIEGHTSGLRVQRTWSTQRPAVGDKIVQRLVITADRDYEFVRLNIDGAACSESVTTRSGYRYSDGLSYYLAVRDASTAYFFDRLPKGTYVLEHTSYVERPGTYSAGRATLQCLYAPEFSAHTEESVLHVTP